MKTIQLLIPAICLLLAGCAKQEITGEKQSFVGLWEEAEKSEDSKYEIEIQQDGLGRYSETSPGSSKEFKGYVYFKSANVFTIGGKLIKKKINVDKWPRRVVESMTPYKYHYEATFNGIRYIRAE
jgi:hypothetical protein